MRYRNYAIVLSAAVFCFSGCGGDTGINENVNTNQNSSPANTNDNGSELGSVEASVTFPEPSPELKMVAIAEEGGVQAEYFQFESDQSDVFSVSRIESVTSSSTWVARFDEAGDAGQLTVGDTDLSVTYNGDGTLNYTLSDGQTVLAAGNAVPRSTSAHRQSQAITFEDIQDCSGEFLLELAESSLDTVDADLVDCLQADSRLAAIGEAICANESVLIPALTIFANQCTSQDDPETCLAKLEAALTASGAISTITRDILHDLIPQLADGFSGNCDDLF
ncbi:MAG: hypothetical protein HJJLKODD_02466 [Phycisphaerae bacterium]|nr:hypothetical protein [Phycisphaerae bacterium]